MDLGLVMSLLLCHLCGETFRVARRTKDEHCLNAVGESNASGINDTLRRILEKRDLLALADHSAVVQDAAAAGENTCKAACSSGVAAPEAQAEERKIASSTRTSEVQNDLAVVPEAVATGGGTPVRPQARVT